MASVQEAVKALKDGVEEKRTVIREVDESFNSWRELLRNAGVGGIAAPVSVRQRNEPKAIEAAPPVIGEPKTPEEDQKLLTYYVDKVLRQATGPLTGGILGVKVMEEGYKTTEEVDVFVNRLRANILQPMVKDGSLKESDIEGRKHYELA